MSLPSASEAAGRTSETRNSQTHRISGPVDTNALADFMRQLQSFHTKDSLILVLDSPGGEMSAANHIAGLIDFLADRGVETTTHIGKGSRCFSACVTIYAAGKHRTAAASARIGLHGMWQAETGLVDRAASQRFVAFLGQRGVDKKWLGDLDRNGAFNRRTMTSFNSAELISTGLVHGISG